MILDLALIAAGIAVLGACLYIWRRRSEVWELLNTRLSTSGLGLDGAGVAGLTVADLIHHINRNTPALLDYLDHMEAGAALSHVADALPLDAVSSAVEQGHLHASALLGTPDLHIYHADLSSLHHAGVDGDHLAFLSHGGMGTVGIDAAHSAVFDVSHVVAHIPVYAIVFHGLRNWDKLQAGDLSEKEWLAHTTGGVVASTGGGGVGAAFGAKAAAALAVPTGGLSVVLIPIGALAGALLGGGLLRKAKVWYYGDDFKAATSALERALSGCRSRCRELRSEFLRHFPVVMRQVERVHREHVHATRSRLRVYGSWFQRTFHPTPMTVGLEESIRRSRREFRQVTRPYYQGLVKEVQKRDHVAGGQFLFNQGRFRFMSVRILEDAHDMIAHALQDVTERREVFEREKRLLEAKL